MANQSPRNSVTRLDLPASRGDGAFAPYQSQSTGTDSGMILLQKEYTKAHADALTALTDAGVVGYSARLTAFLNLLALSYDVTNGGVVAYQIVTLCLLGQYGSAREAVQKTFPAALDEDKFVTTLHPTSEAVDSLLIPIEV